MNRRDRLRRLALCSQALSELAGSAQKFKTAQVFALVRGDKRTRREVHLLAHAKKSWSTSATYIDAHFEELLGATKDGSFPSIEVCMEMVRLTSEVCAFNCKPKS